MKFIIGWYAFGFVMLCGWVVNIVKLVGVGFNVAEWGGFEVARAIGVFVAPLGAVLGFL